MEKQASKHKSGTGSSVRNVRSAAAVDQHERGKDFFDEQEMDKLLAAARKTRHRERDYCLVLLMYRHGFRVSEITQTRIADVKLETARIWVERMKGSLSTEHALEGDELRAVRAWLRARKDALPWLFVTERGGQMTRKGVYSLIERLGDAAGVGHATPHMLRHSCGYYLANAGHDTRLIQDFLGHRNPRHTTRYTRIAGSRFEGLWSKRRHK